MARPVDVLVIGGGIYGAWVAYDAALRGLTVAIVERTDWGAGTSSASSKLIHGGLRYLEYGHLALVRTALSERRRLLRLGPHRIRPLRFLLPVWQDSRTAPLLLSLGLALYDLLAGESDPAATHRRFDAHQLRRRCPFLEPRTLRAGFAYRDAGEDDARYVLEIIDGAVAHGALAVNHLEALELLGEEALHDHQPGRITGARLRDRLSGDELTLRASLTVLATGPWLPTLARQAGLDLPVRLTKGVHLVMPPLPAPMDDHQALLLTARSDGRVFFLIPWYGATLLGTTDTDAHDDPSTVGADAAAVDYLLRAVAERCPGLQWTRADVRGAFAGLRTMQHQPARSASAASREWTLSEPRPGLLVPIGGKLTSARADAAVIVDRICRRLAKPGRCATGERPLPWAPRQAFDAWVEETVARATGLGLSAEEGHTLAHRYGQTVDAVLERIRAHPGLAQRIHPQVPMLLAEALHAVEAEMACDLDDVLRRRVPVAILARLSLAQVDQVASVIAPSLGWDAARAQRESHAWLADLHVRWRALGLTDVPQVP